MVKTMVACHPAVKYPAMIAFIGLAGCATVAPSEKPKDAVELRGVVVDVNVVPNYGPSALQSQLAGAVGHRWCWALNMPPAPRP